VPEDSLARRRAGDAELTAASDHLKIGTLVRVTRVSNGRSVVVRITDTGLDATAARIDVCKEAAEQLDMVNDGIAKVRLQVLPPNARAGATLVKP
jgi:rare lipoprotein A